MILLTVFIYGLIFGVAIVSKLKIFELASKMFDYNYVSSSVLLAYYNFKKFNVFLYKYLRDLLVYF